MNANISMTPAELFKVTPHRVDYFLGRRRGGVACQELSANTFVKVADIVVRSRHMKVYFMKRAGGTPKQPETFELLHAWSFSCS